MSVCQISSRQPRSAGTSLAVGACRLGGHRGSGHDATAASTCGAVADDQPPVHEAETDQRHGEAQHVVEHVAVDHLVHGVCTELGSVPLRRPVRIVTAYLQLEKSVEYSDRHRNRM